MGHPVCQEEDAGGITSSTDKKDEESEDETLRECYKEYKKKTSDLRAGRVKSEGGEGGSDEIK